MIGYLRLSSIRFRTIKNIFVWIIQTQVKDLCMSWLKDFLNQQLMFIYI